MITNKELTKGLLNTLLILGGIALLLWFLFSIKMLLIHIIIALIISTIGHPIISFLQKRLRFGKTLSVMVTIFSFFGLIVGFIFLCIPLIKTQSENLSLLNTEQLQQNLLEVYHQIQAYLDSKHISLFESFGNDAIGALNNLIPSLINSVVGALGNIGITVFNVSFISFFFMKDSSLFERILLTPFSLNSQPRIKNSLYKIKKLLSGYFIGLCLQISILFIIYTTTLLIFGVNNAFLIALLCAMLNLIPYVGPLVSGLLMIILTMSSHIGDDFLQETIPTTLYVIIGFLIGQLIDNLFSQPFIFSKSVKSHPLEIFMVIIVGSLLYGAVGMVIAVPAYTSIRVITKEFLSDNRIVKSLTKDL